MSKAEIEKAIGRIREEYFINGIGARYTEIYTDDLKILLDYTDGLEKFNREIIEYKTNLECKIGELEEDKEELKRRIRVKKQEHEHLRDFYKINAQGYSFGKEVEIIKEYEELLEEDV